MNTKLLILDLDGTARRPKSGAKFINKPLDQEIIPEAAKRIEEYFKNNWVIVGATNQGGVAAGHKSLEEAIEEQKITLQLLSPMMKGIFFCPDYEGENCYFVSLNNSPKQFVRSHLINPNYPSQPLYESFRKPGSGMLMLALDDGKEMPSDVLYVGDRDEDEKAAISANIPFMWAADWWKSKLEAKEVCIDDLPW